MQQERERLTSCFKEPEFLKLFKEYADEVSDPKNREEHEQYIRQCEAQGMNDGAVQMVIPDPGFCVKVRRPSISRVHAAERCRSPSRFRPSLPYRDLLSRHYNN